jgi:CRISPR-associated protein Cmr6
MAYGKYVVPGDTARIASRHVKACQNFALTLKRYAPQEAIEETDRLNDRRRSIGKERNFWLQDICHDFMPDSDLIASTHQRWRAMTEGAARFTMVSRSRMIVGLGGKGALEFGITLHSVTGLPYIPGSALKGLCRNYALYYIAEKSGISLDPAQVKNTSEVANQLDDHLTGIKDYRLKVHPEYAAMYRNLFGTQEEAGQCVFYDAVIRDVPPNIPLFAVEVMTPHFRKYYESGGKDAPHDADDPNPITHIAVNTGIAFAFAIGKRHGIATSPLVDARDLLRLALGEMGTGAKTAAGYGVFYDPKAR